MTVNQSQPQSRKIDGIVFTGVGAGSGRKARRARSKIRRRLARRAAVTTGD